MLNLCKILPAFNLTCQLCHRHITLQPVVYFFSIFLELHKTGAFSLPKKFYNSIKWRNIIKLLHFSLHVSFHVTILSTHIYETQYFRVAGVSDTTTAAFSLQQLTYDDPLKPHSRFETSRWHICESTLETVMLYLSRTPSIDSAKDYA